MIYSSIRPRRLLLTAGMLMLLPCALREARGEFLKIGNLSFTSGLNFTANYSTNVDQVPDGVETTEDPEDFYITYGGNLSATAAYFPKFTVTANTSLTWEKHFIKEGQDTKSDPIGNLSVLTSGSSGPWGYTLSYVRTEALTSDDPQQVIIGGRTQLAKDRLTTEAFNSGLTWAYQSLSLNSTYINTRERHQEGYTEGDLNGQILNAGAVYRLHPRVSLNYRASWTKDEYPNQTPAPGADSWLRTQTAGFTYRVLTKPVFTIGVNAEREEEIADRKGEWEPVYTFTLSDNRALAPNLTLNGSATYSIEKNPEADDIAFTYNAGLVHTLPHGWSQTVNFTREPAQTFGSSVESDSTTYTYVLTQPDFIFRRLSMNFSFIRSIDQPPEDAPEEVSDDWVFSLTKTLTPLIRNFTHSLRYSYLIKDSNLSGKAEEHLGTYTAGLNF